jgi:hypothetical protein
LVAGLQIGEEIVRQIMLDEARRERSVAAGAAERVQSARNALRASRTRCQRHDCHGRRSGEAAGGAMIMQRYRDRLWINPNT